MLEQVFFISMEGRSDFFIENFQVREDVPLPVLASSETLSKEDITPDNIILGIQYNPLYTNEYANPDIPKISDGQKNNPDNT